MMTYVRKALRTAALALLGLALAGPLTALAAETTDKGARRTIQPVPAAAPLQARVAQGGVVPLAPSQLSQAQLAGMRPNYQALKPRLGNP